MAARSLAFILVILAGCYGHTRRDAPSPAPEGVAADMVSIPSGTFTRGDRNGEPDEYPEKQIRMQGFRIDRMEVTNLAYRACVDAKACDPTPFQSDERLGLDDHPVVGVAYDDAARFCRWIGRRLPTEAEWEYAAKGTDLRKWPWVGAFDPKRSNSVQDGDFHGKTAPVNAYPTGVSPFGVIQMAGNAAEWVADYFHPTYYRTSEDDADPKGPNSGRERVVRGGSYLDPMHLVRVSARRAKLPTETDNSIGLRCAAD